MDNLTRLNLAQPWRAMCIMVVLSAGRVPKDAPFRDDGGPLWLIREWLAAKPVRPCFGAGTRVDVELLLRGVAGPDCPARRPLLDA